MFSYSGGNPERRAFFHFTVDSASSLTLTKYGGYTPHSTNPATSAACTMVDMGNGKAVILATDDATNHVASVVTWNASGVTAQGSWTTFQSGPYSGLVCGACADRTNDRIFITYFGYPGGTRTYKATCLTVSGTSITAGSATADLSGGAEDYQSAGCPIFDSDQGIFYAVVINRYNNRIAVKAFDCSSGSPSSSGSVVLTSTSTLASSVLCNYDSASSRIWILSGWATGLYLTEITPQSDTSDVTLVEHGVISDYTDFGLSTATFYPFYYQMDVVTKKMADYGGRFLFSATGFSSVDVTFLTYDAANRTIKGFAQEFVGIADASGSDTDTVTINFGSIQTGGQFAGYAKGTKLYINAAGKITDSDSGVFVGTAMDTNTAMITGGGEPFGQLKAEE